MRRLHKVALVALAAIWALSIGPIAAQAQSCPPGTSCAQDDSGVADGNSAAAKADAKAKAKAKAKSKAPPRTPATAQATGKAQPGAARPWYALGANTFLALAIIVFITAAALMVAIYPIRYYIRQVWQTRRRMIFDTLSTEARREYLKLFRKSESAVSQSNKDVELSFEKIYDHWFGRQRLLTPAWLIGIILLAYVFLGAIRAAQALLPPPLWHSPFTLEDTAMGAITGAYILVTMDIINRVVRRDLLPEDLQLTALRLISCVPFGYAFASLVKPGVAPFVALAVTAIPLPQLAAWLGQLGSKQLGLAAAAATSPGADAPNQLAGVDQAVCERLGAIGVNTITQIAYSDPVQLTMRTSLNFVFVLDVVSQALAWVYLEQKLNLLRPMGLRGAFEIAALRIEAMDPDPKKKESAANARAVIDQLPAILGLTQEQCRNVLHQIADDDYTKFVVVAYLGELVDQDRARRAAPAIAS